MRKGGDIVSVKIQKEKEKDHPEKKSDDHNNRNSYLESELDSGNVTYEKINTISHPPNSSSIYIDKNLGEQLDEFIDVLINIEIITPKQWENIKHDV
jgi:hypothetical protein